MRAVGEPGQGQQVAQPHHQQHHQFEETHQYVVRLGTEAQLDEGGDSQALAPTAVRHSATHMSQSTMNRYGIETISPTHNHHLTTDHLADNQKHLTDPEDEGRFAMRTNNLGVLFPTLNATSNATEHHSQHHHHVEDIVPEDPYLQQPLRSSADVTPSPQPIRNGSSPGSTGSPQKEQMSSPNAQHDGTYSPGNDQRIHNFTHLTSMQPPTSVQATHHIQDNERVADHMYMDSIYGHHQPVAAHHQEHDHSAAPHSPGHLPR